MLQSKCWQTVLDELASECKRIDEAYSITIQYFKPGDTVYYVTNHGDVVRAEVTELADFSEGGTVDGGCIYYWIRPDGCKLTWKNRLHSSLLRSLPFFLLRLIPYRFKNSAPSCFPGHAVTAGDDIFKTREEAEYTVNVYNAHFYLKQLIDSTVD